MCFPKTVRFVVAQFIALCVSPIIYAKTPQKIAKLKRMDRYIMTTTDYINEIEKELQTGHATEHSYRPMLRQFLVGWSQNFSSATDYHITNEPKRNARNAPDFLVRRDEVSLGWIETKPPGTNLDTEAESEQLQRYRKAFPNLILTDYLEFRLYSEGGKMSLSPYRGLGQYHTTFNTSKHR